MSPEKAKPKQPKKKRIPKKTKQMFSAKNLMETAVKYFETEKGKRLKWWLWDFSGLRYIRSKIITPLEPGQKERKPATFFLWALGIYTALYGITSTRYENRVDIIENRANAIFTQLATPVWEKALERIPRIQGMPCPVKPHILKPWTVFASLLGIEGRYEVMVVHLKETVEDWKDKLQGVDLSEARLHGADLRGANLENAYLTRAYLTGAYLILAYLSGADLRGANLENADLTWAYLTGADLILADLSGAYLRGAYLTWAYLSGADLIGANLKGADLREVNLSGADLKGARGLTEEQLSHAFTLYKVKGLDPALEKSLKTKKPGLFEEPDYDKFWEARKRILKEAEREEAEAKAEKEKKKQEGAKREEAIKLLKSLLDEL